MKPADVQRRRRVSPAPQPAAVGRRGHFTAKAEELIAEFRGCAGPETAGRRSRRLRETRALADLVGDCFKAYSIGTEGPVEILASRWSSLVDPRFANRSHPSRLDAGELFVSVNNPSLRSAMQFEVRSILREIGKVPGCEGIQKIRLVAG